MRRIRTIIVLVLSVTLLAGTFSACGKKPSTDSTENTEETTETETTDQASATEGETTPGAQNTSDSTVFTNEEYAYKLDEVLAECSAYCDVAYNDDCFAVGSTEYDEDYMYGNAGSYPDGFRTLTVNFYDYNGRLLGGFTEHNDSSDSYYNFNLDSKGNVYFIHSIQNYDIDGNYFTAYELLGYNKKGEIIDSAIFEDEDDDFYVKDIMIDDKDRLIALTNKGFMTFRNREIADRIDYDDAEDFAECFPLSNGDILLTRYGVADKEISIINFDSRMRKDLGEPPFTLSAVYGVSGGDDCDLILCGDNGIYKYNAGEDDYEEVMALPVNDKHIAFLDDVKVLKDGNVIGSYYDADKEDYKIARFVPDDMSADTRKKLTVAGVGISGDILNQIYAFNEENDEYRMVVHDYSKIDMLLDFDKGNEAFANDMKKGSAADIMFFNYGQPFKAYMSQGLLADLKPMIEEDPKYDLDDYAPNVIEALSMGDKLYMFSPDFVVNTALCKSAYMNGKAGYKLSDFMSTADWTGASVYGNDTTRSVLFYNIMRNTADDYIDWENLTCDFDNTSFKKILAFANTYPQDYDYEYDNSHEGPYNSYPVPYRNGEVLCEIKSIYDINSYIESRQAVFGDNITMVGFPTTGDVGSSIYCYNSMAISASCDDMDGAWEFVRRFLDPKIADEMYLNLPTAKSELEKRVRSAGEKIKTYTDEDYYTWEPITYLVGSEYVELKPLSGKEGDALIKELYEIDRLAVDYDDIFAILNEEAEGYFMGAYDTNTAAASIQEKMSKYLESLR